MIDVLALGAGVQTTALYMMAAIGQIKRPDCAVFADPGWEPPAVYRNLDWLRNQAANYYPPIYTIDTGNIRSQTLHSHLVNALANPGRIASMPLFTLDRDGHKGMLRRQCTLQYKIRPIDKFIRQNLLAIGPRKHAPPGSACIWFGITTDEERRARPSQAAWKTHRFPLIELNKSRDDCHKWLEDNNIHQPARSSCVGCPFRSNAEWAWLKQNQPDAFWQAVEFDRLIRNPHLIDAQLFLHQSRIPLNEVDFDDLTRDIEKNPWTTECLGYCGA